MERVNSSRSSKVVSAALGWIALVGGVGITYVLSAAPLERLSWEVRAVRPVVDHSAMRTFFWPARRVAECKPFVEPIHLWKRVWGVDRRNWCSNSLKNLAVALQNYHDSRCRADDKMSADSLSCE